MFWMGRQSQKLNPEDLGLSDENLKSCGQKPNCVSSRAPLEGDHYIAPLSGKNISQLWENLPTTLSALGFKKVSHQGNYYHYTATSSLFSFVDDMEFLYKPDENIIDVRSKSRVGYSDLGANRKRIETIRKALTE